MPVFDQERVDRLKQILKWHPRGITISDLSTKMEMNRNLVAKYLDILLISGQVEMQVIGAAKVYFLSHRIPISSMLEFSSDMLIILDSSLTIMQVNEPLLVQVHEKKESLVGRKIKDVDHPFISAIPVTLPSQGSDPTHDQVREIECTLEGKKHYFKIKQLQTAFEDGSQGITLIIEDITDQVTYQKMLELNEAKYRGIVEDQTEFITRFLPDGTLVFINDAYARYLGKKKEELLGGQHIPDIEGDDIQTMHQCIQSLDTNNPVQTFECRIHHSCGQVRWNLWTVRVLFDDNQKPLEYQGVGRDNTEKREAATRINQYVRDMEFLSRKAQEFVELSLDADIFQAIAQGLLEIIPDSLITVNSIDVLSDTLTIRAVLPNQDRDLFTKFLGRDLRGFQFNTSSLPAPKKLKFFSEQQTGKLVRVEENLHTIFFQQIPQDTCDRIKETFNLGDSLYTIGLTRHGILFGNVSFSPRKGETVTNSSIIETFIRQASIVLHRRRTDDALKASELRYRGIVEDQTEFVTRFLPDGTLTYVNDSVCRYFLQDRAELIGQSIFSPVLKEDQEQVIQDLHSLNADNPVRTTENRMPDPSGRIRWTQWTTRALFDDHGTIIEYQGVGRDITEQKEADAKIRQYIADIEYLSQKSSEFLELSPDADIYGIICQGVKRILPNAIVIVNSDGVNSDDQEKAITRSVLGDEEREVFSTLIGVEIIGMSVKLPKPTELQKERRGVISRSLVKVPGNLFITMHRNVPEEICAKIEEALNIGDIYAIGLVSQGIILASMVIMLRKGDTLEHSNLIEAYIRQASIALLRCRTEQTLKKSESRYRGIVEDQTEFVTRFLPDGTLTYVNDAVCRYFQSDRQELIGQSIFSPVLKEDQERMIQDLHSLNAENPVRTTENRVLDSRERIRWMQWTTRALFNDHGTIIEYQGVGRDITEQKEADAKISQYIADIEYLSQKSHEFLELPPDADIYGTICRGVKDILPKAIVLVNTFDLKNDATTRSVLGDEEREVFSTLMGEDIIGKIVKVPMNFHGDNAVKINASGRIVRVPGNLFIATQKNVPEEVCKKIEDTLNIGDIYLIGLVSQGIILADVVIMLRKGDKLSHVDLIEAYIRQAANTLLRQKTAETLRESEKLYRSVIENIQDVFYRSDIKGILIMASPSWARMLGYDSLDDCIGYNIAEKFYFEPERRKEFLEAVYRNGSVSDYEVTLKCRDGSPFYVLTNSHLYYDEAGSLLGVEGIFRDSSERHAAAEKIQHYINTLKEREEIFSSVAQYAPVSIAIIEPDGTYRYVNQKFIATFGYDLNDFKTGREWFSLAFPDPEYRKKVIDSWKSDLETYNIGIERPEIFTVRCKNGVDREIVFRPVTLSDRKQCVVYEDLTDQHKAEHVQKLLSMIVETTSDAIIGEKIDGTIISWNPAAEHLYGYTKGEAIGHPISMIIPQNHQEEFSGIFNRIKNGEPINNLETRRMCKDGKVIDVEVTIFPITDETGIVIGASTIAKNISLKKSGEQLQERGEKDHPPLKNMNEEMYRIMGDPAIKSTGIVNQIYLSNALKMARDYIAILDRTGKCVWVNDALVSAVNAASCNDLAGKSIALYIAPEFRKIALDSLMEIKKTGNKTVPLMMLSSSGRVPVEANISAINTEEGDLFGYMAIARNVERDQVEKPRR